MLYGEACQPTFSASLAKAIWKVLTFEEVTDGESDWPRKSVFVPTTMSVASGQ